MPGRGPGQDAATVQLLEERHDVLAARSSRVAQCGRVLEGADVVHASFNVSDRNAKLLAILGPCVGSEGYELVDVAQQEPWVSLK